MVIFDTKEWEILEFLISVKLLNEKVNSDKLSDYILKSMKSSFDKSCVFGKEKKMVYLKTGLPVWKI